MTKKEKAKIVAKSEVDSLDDETVRENLQELKEDYLLSPKGADALKYLWNDYVENVYGGKEPNQ